MLRETLALMQNAEFIFVRRLLTLKCESLAPVNVALMLCEILAHCKMLN